MIKYWYRSIKNTLTLSCYLLGFTFSFISCASNQSLREGSVPVIKVTNPSAKHEMVSVQKVSKSDNERPVTQSYFEPDGSNPVFRYFLKQEMKQEGKP